MTVKREKGAKERRKYNVKLIEKIVERSIKARSVQPLFHRQNNNNNVHTWPQVLKEEQTASAPFRCSS